MARRRRNRNPGRVSGSGLSLVNYSSPHPHHPTQSCTWNTLHPCKRSPSRIFIPQREQVSPAPPGPTPPFPSYEVGGVGRVEGRGWSRPSVVPVDTSKGTSPCVAHTSSSGVTRSNPHPHPHPHPHPNDRGDQTGNPLVNSPLFTTTKSPPPPVSSVFLPLLPSEKNSREQRP